MPPVLSMSLEPSRAGLPGLAATLLLLLPLLGACGSPDAEPRSAARESAGTASAPDLSGEGAGRKAPQSADTTTVDVSDLGFTRGAPDAPVRVIEFSDFGCGYCRKFHMETFPTLADEYIDTGKVAWKYIPSVLGMFPNAVEAAIAGECAGRQDHFRVMRDRLFEDQREWRKSSDPYAVFKEYAAEEGLDTERFARCVDQRLPADRVRSSIAAGRKVGVRGTPMFLINGFPVQGALPLDAFREIFRRVLESRQSGGPGS